MPHSGGLITWKNGAEPADKSRVTLHKTETNGTTEPKKRQTYTTADDDECFRT